MKKILSFTLSLILIFTLCLSMGISALAAETTVTTSAGLKEALAAGGTVKLGANLTTVYADLNVPEGIATVLDFNGYTLTTTNGIAGTINGTLTITDSSEGKTGTLQSANASTSTREFFMIAGELTINGGTFNGATQSACMFSGLAGSKMTVNGGVFNVNCTTGAINTVFSNINSIKTLVINGGTFNATGASQYSLYYANNTSVTVSGGTFVGTISDSNKNIVYKGVVSTEGNTTTVVPSTTTLVGTGTDSHDVKAKYNGGTETPDVYSVDVEWGAMEFTYNVSGSKDWDATDHSYTDNSVASWSASGNTVTVTNHSNAAVTASFGFTKGTGITEDITGTFDTTSEELDAGVVGGYATADSVTSTLTIGGALDSAKTTFTKIGTVTVTIQ